MLWYGSSTLVVWIAYHHNIIVVAVCNSEKEDVVVCGDGIRTKKNLPLTATTLIFGCVHFLYITHSSKPYCIV